MYVVTTNTFHTVRHHPRRPDGPFWMLPARTSLHLPSIPSAPAPGAAPTNVMPPRHTFTAKVLGRTGSEGVRGMLHER